MVRKFIAMTVFVYILAGRMYAGNDVNQVLNSYSVPVKILQEQIFSQKVASNFEITIPIEFEITILGETYHVVGSIYIGNERQHFVEIELDIYNATGDLRYHLESTYNEDGERTGLLVTNPSGELIDNIPSEIHTIMDEVDNLVTNALQNI